jgi:hypothetical protein
MMPAPLATECSQVGKDAIVARVKEGNEVPVTWLKGEAFRLTMELESHAEAAARHATEQGPALPAA